MSELNLFTSESVSEGHPDKLADQISDAILDALLEKDKLSRVALETLLTRGLAVIAGELTTNGYVNINDIVRSTINNVGYTHTAYGFDGDTTGVMLAIQNQSVDISQGVDTGGAGDQGMMFGFACDETSELMPLPITIAHRLTRVYAEVRASRPELGFRPDAKSQVTVVYVDGKPLHIDTIVFSAQHEPELDQEEIAARVKEHVIRPVLLEFSKFDAGNITYHINPTGKFVIGGPQGDTGLTGRKIIVDTYGGYARHGGGAFSGKDPSKVDRSAAYAARYLAKNVVKSGLASKCEIQLAYAIGVAEPVSVFVDTFGTGMASPDDIAAKLKNAKVGLSPKAIIERLSLLDVSRIKYRETARNGHFGHPEFPWEVTDLAAAIA